MNFKKMQAHIWLNMLEHLQVRGYLEISLLMLKAHSQMCDNIIPP